jgi:hypothetical protein
VVNVEENRAVLRLRATYIVRDSEHKPMGQLRFPPRCRLWLGMDVQFHSHRILFRKQSQAL